MEQTCTLLPGVLGRTSIVPQYFTVSLAPLWLFFFSSRRRHTRLQGDWSSDVCSSDLALRGRRSFPPARALLSLRGSASGRRNVLGRDALGHRGEQQPGVLVLRAVEHLDRKSVV